MDTRARHARGRPLKPIDACELKHLLDEGRSLRQIARNLKRGYGAVYRAVKALRRGVDDPKMTEVIQNPAA